MHITRSFPLRSLLCPIYCFLLMTISFSSFFDDSEGCPLLPCKVREGTSAFRRVRETHTFTEPPAYQTPPRQIAGQGDTHIHIHKIPCLPDCTRQIAGQRDTNIHIHRTPCLPDCTRQIADQGHTHIRIHRTPCLLDCTRQIAGQGDTFTLSTIKNFTTAIAPPFVHPITSLPATPTHSVQKYGFFSQPTRWRQVAKYSNLKTL